MQAKDKIQAPNLVHLNQYPSLTQRRFGDSKVSLILRLSSKRFWGRLPMLPALFPSMNDQGSPTGALTAVTNHRDVQHSLPPPKHNPLPFEFLASA